MNVILISVLVLAVGILIGYIIRRLFVEAGLENAKKLAQSIIEEANKDAENIKKEANLQAKDRLYQGKIELDKEIKERRHELQNLEKRLSSKEENLDRKIELFDKKEAELLKREKDIVNRDKIVQEKERQYTELLNEQKVKLERVSGMSSEEAKRVLIESMEDEAKHDAAKLIKAITEEAIENANKKAQEIMATAIQRYAGEYVAERTTSVVNLPNDEMKGRIIGREGRNIRAIEAATGIDIIIDDTPEAVILSGHNPVRREIAKITIERLIADGRIHPARVEEVVEKVEQEIEQTMKEAGERAVFDTGMHGIHPDIVKLIGRLKFRTSYAQNVYVHSMEVAFICGIMAAELGLSTKQARRAGLLHDIGKAVDHEVEGPHAAIGGDLARKYGESPKIVSAITEHHDDHPASIMGILVQAADALSAARPGARKEMMETYVKRLEDLEKIATSFSGVEKSYAIQAGREIRVIVSNQTISDEGAVVLSKDIARKIEKELSYPGQIKVTVIREARAVDYAR
ncbi:MAG: ribonuclease Y [Deltaproteobacteria bacterium GWC2_42_11]|nr:MAG: ribonuclease Y [Deltaproteobacteria bacterium GWC2_42_11]